MRRTIPLLAAALVAVPLGLVAEAAPVAQARLALADLTLTGDEGTSQRIRLTVTDAARPRLTLQVSDCDASGCVGFDYFETRLAPAAVRLDPSTATGELRTTLGGRELHIAWTPDRRPSFRGGSEGTSGDDGETFSVYRAEPAYARILLGGATCTGSGGVGDEVRLENRDGSPGAAQPLAQFRPAARLTCAS